MSDVELVEHSSFRINIGPDCAGMFSNGGVPPVVSEVLAAVKIVNASRLAIADR